MVYILGIEVSKLVSYLKRIFGTNEYKTLFVLLLVSIASAAVFVLFKDTSLWLTVVQVLVTASLVLVIAVLLVEGLAYGGFENPIAVQKTILDAVSKCNFTLMLV